MSPLAVITSLFPSMFHRRLLLLFTLLLLAMLPLFLRLTSLTVFRSEELRQEAEKRLVRRQWTSTVRGSILDRKGRVLAQDRPSYDVAVAYPVITGQWVTDQSGRAARRAAGARWADMDADERQALTAKYRSAYLLHLDRGWNELAARLGITRQELDKRRDQIVAEVTSKQRHNTEVLIRRSLAQKLDVDPSVVLETWKQVAATVDPDVDHVMRTIAAGVVAALDPTGKKVNETELRNIVRHGEQPIAETTQAHVLAYRVSDEVGFQCRRLAWEEVELDPSQEEGQPASDNPDMRSLVEAMPGLTVIDGGDRDYPLESTTVQIDLSTLPGPLRQEAVREVRVEGVATHILGRIRNRVQREDIPRRAEYLASNLEAREAAIIEGGTDRGMYRDGDRVGDTGVEGSQENILRGLRGLQTSRLDNDDRVYLEPVKGRDVQLTIDAALQARVQAVMSPELGLAVVAPWQSPLSLTHPEIPGTPKVGQPLEGAAVVLDIDSGDILAMVSMPSYTRAQARERPEEVYGDPLSTPYLNRAIAKPYQPGSIVKPLILVGAAKHHDYSPWERIACTGHFYPNRPDMFRCWIYKQYSTTHNARLGGDLTGPQAIMVSCNIFFFTLGNRLGVDGIQSVYRDFGVGQRFNIGVGQEFAGALGLNGRPETLKLPDAVQMGIGQGPVTWTPLHAAAAYATLARYGNRCHPRLIMGQNPPEGADLKLDPRVVDEAMEGLRLSVEDSEGTGHHITMPGGHRENIFNAPGVRVWGKTGTAAASPIIGDPDGETGPEPRQVLAAGDHSWFVVLVGRDRPRYVISVVTDFGGSGGKVSGPICNQIIHALIAEGYL
jgi:penicillin-binding protein 2